MSTSFRVYIIKCAKTEKCYISYTESPNKSYNPITYLNSVYKKTKDKYIELGKSIEEHGLKEHKYLFVKENLTKEQAIELTESLREKTVDRSLHDGATPSIFDKELAMILKDELEIIRNDEDINDA